MDESCYININRNKRLRQIRPKIGNGALHMYIDENTCETGSFTIDSAIGYYTTWLPLYGKRS
jgi:hypothetical protein